MKKENILFSLLTALLLCSFAYAQPAAPENLTGKTIQMGPYKLISLTWNYKTDSTNVQFTVYKKKGSLEDPGTYEKAFDRTFGTSFIDKNIEPNTTYSYYVTAINQSGESPASNKIDVKADSGSVSLKPAAPVNLAASVQQWEGIPYVNLTWGYNADIRDIKFEVYKKSDNDSSYHKMFGLMDGQRYIDKNIEQGRTYSYYVTAVSWTDESSSSDTVSIKIDSALAKTKSLLNGSVTDEATGTPIKGASVNIISAYGWRQYSVATNESGIFSQVLPAGSYVLMIRAENYIPEFYDNTRNIFDAQKITLKGDTVNIAISLKKKVQPVVYSLSGTVKDTTGIPLHAKITAYILNDYHRIQREARAVTDSLGSYKLNLMNGDSVVVYVESKNKNYISEFYNDKKEFAEADRLVISSDTTINFVLDAKPVYANGISGSVYTADSVSTPLQANVTVFKLRENMDSKNFRRTVMSDSLGNYSLTNLAPGNYIALVMPLGGYLPTFYRADGVNTIRWKLADTLTVTESGIVSGINFMVNPLPDSGYGTISGIVTNPSKKMMSGTNGVQGALVYVTDENDNVVSSATTEADGSFTISGLEPGSYSVSTDKVAYTSSTTASVPVSYITSDASPLTLNMSPESTTDVSESGNSVVSNYSLEQNYPNPFNPSTNIRFSVPNSGLVNITVYNLLGQKVAGLVNEIKAAGTYNISFNAYN
ncbi:MAG: carboxypeptidase regulatory-like domain-containing protein, partial [Bacteroidota bacterium]|nr:carboxypeptidase regulatory-like domain-containing protein [Bacteroidota bacterium]